MADTKNSDERGVGREAQVSTISGERGSAPGSPERDSLEAELAQLVRTVEAQSTQQVLASILLLDADGRHLRHGAAPSLPAAYCQAIDGIEIGPSQGSCGTAAYYRRTVVVDDTQRNVLWENFKELAAEHGLRACWSTPILSSADEKVLGTFALYHRFVAVPSKADIELVSRLVDEAAVILERHAR